MVRSQLGPGEDRDARPVHHEDGRQILSVAGVALANEQVNHIAFVRRHRCTAQLRLRVEPIVILDKRGIEAEKAAGELKEVDALLNGLLGKVLKSGEFEPKLNKTMQDAGVPYFKLDLTQQPAAPAGGRP